MLCSKKDYLLSNSEDCDCIIDTKLNSSWVRPMSSAYRILYSSHSLLNTIFLNSILPAFGLIGNDRQGAIYFFTSTTTKN